MIHTMLWYKIDNNINIVDNDLIVQTLEEEHDGARAVVRGDWGGAQLVDVAAVVHVDGLGLIGVKSNNGLQKGNIDIDN